MITDEYMPSPERLRDWLSNPKSNGYEYKVTLNSVLGNDGFATFATANPHLINEKKEE